MDTVPMKVSIKQRIADGFDLSHSIPGEKEALAETGPTRATGLWSVDDVVDKAERTVDFRRIDDVESEVVEMQIGRDNAVVPVADEDAAKHRLMFVEKFVKTPKHLTWQELEYEMDSLDCEIDMDEHRPEEIFTLSFSFVNKARGIRDKVWSARNDVQHSEGLTDLLAALGSCLGRADVHRTVRFDDGQGTTREVNIRKNSRYTSEVVIAFRPSVVYDIYSRTEEQKEYETEMSSAGMSTWGYHPSLMDPEYRDAEDPVGTYHLTLSAHALTAIVVRAFDRLLARPLKDFYRPSQIARTVKVSTREDIGATHAMLGWLGMEPLKYAHFTTMEAIQHHWFGPDAPFQLTAIINKLREMCYLKKQNPELRSWLSGRRQDTAFALRNIQAKLLGAGASPLFQPMGHHSTINRLLPKPQQRRLTANVSLAAAFGLPDETRRLDDIRKITGKASMADDDSTSSKRAVAPPSDAGGAGLRPQVMSAVSNASSAARDEKPSKAA